MENYTFTITVKDIYGTENPEIPKGYKVVGFRFPKKGELFFLKHGGMLSDPCSAEDERYHKDDLEPRLILKKLPEKRLLSKEIANCYKCHHCRRDEFTYPSVTYMCTSDPERRRLGDLVQISAQNIPTWCPLPIAKEE